MEGSRAQACVKRLKIKLRLKPSERNNQGNAACGYRARHGEKMDLELLSERARIIRSVRKFFDERNYLETDTPLLAPDLIPESCLEVFETLRLQPAGSSKKKQAVLACSVSGNLDEKTDRAA